MTFWTYENKERLKQYLAQDLSFRQIAVNLGISRNAVAGASHRLFGTGGSVPSAPWTDDERHALRTLVAARKSVSEICDAMNKGRKAIEKQLKKLGLKAKRVDFMLNQRPQGGKIAPQMLTKEQTEPPTPLPFLSVTLYDLKANQCRYPHGDGPYLFCGQPTDKEHSYCTFHHSLCNMARSEIANRGFADGVARIARLAVDDDNERRKGTPDLIEEFSGRPKRGRPVLVVDTGDITPWRQVGDVAAEIVRRIA